MREKGVYKVGIIGFGKIGQLRAQLVENHPDTVVDSICEINLSAVPEKITYPCFTDYLKGISKNPFLLNFLK
jgi:glyceraldehyde-3-phosphate dehydrogenase/erythrose-4-phosphate dehydrogenase